MREMDHFFFVKPVSGHEFNPSLMFENPFDSIAAYTKDRERIVFMRCPKDNTEEMNDDTYLGRGTIHLSDVEVEAKISYPKRKKLMGYLDSISSPSGQAWVCGCASGCDGYLNDYKYGYTHHPEWINDYQPKEHTKPIKGKYYLMIKYLPGGDTGRGYVADMKYIIWNGDEYSEEELLRMNNLWKATGYYESPEFPMPDEIDANSSLADIRNTLLWIPQATTDEDGSYHTTITTSDICSRFLINIIAVTPGGDIGACRHSFDIGN